MQKIIDFVQSIDISPAEQRKLIEEASEVVDNRGEQNTLELLKEYISFKPFELDEDRLNTNV